MDNSKTDRTNRLENVGIFKIPKKKFVYYTPEQNKQDISAKFIEYIKENITEDNKGNYIKQNNLVHKRSC